MFSLTISGATLDEFNGAIAAFSAGGAVSGKTTSRKAVVLTAAAVAAAAPAAPVAAPVVEAPAAAALTAEQEKAIERGDTVALSPAQVQAIVAAPAAELEQKVRALLTPLLRDPDHAPKVALLMQEFGATKLSKIPADKMAEALAAAEALVAKVAA